MNDFQRFLDENLGNIDIEGDSDVPEYGETYNNYDEIRNAITVLRKENNMTQKDLAMKTGLTQANICKLEKGTTKPTLDTLRKIADATGTRLVVRFAGQEVL